MRTEGNLQSERVPQHREDAPYTLTIGPHGHFWLLLEPTAQSVALESGELSLPLLPNVANYDDLTTAAVRSRLQGKILPAYLPTCRWFRSRRARSNASRVRRVVPVSDQADASRLLWLDVSYTEGMPETYALPLQILPAEAVKARRSTAPTSCIAALSDGGALCDASADETFQRDLLKLVVEHKSVPDGARGSLVGVASETARAGLGALGDDVACRALGVEQSNTSIVYQNEYFLKLYRKVEEGENPDIELTRLLTEKAGFASVPPYAGQIEFRPADRKKPTEVLALMQSWVASEGDAWTLTVDAASRFFERVLAARNTPAKPRRKPRRAYWQTTSRPRPAAVQDVIGGIYTSRAELLGQRTGELHLALSGEAAVRCRVCRPSRSTCCTNARWNNPFNTLTRKVFAGLRRKLSSLPEALQGDRACSNRKKRSPRSQRVRYAGASTR